ncbi:MAG: c-type cytochrome [Bryobacteraceae bacterium]
MNSVPGAKAGYGRILTFALDSSAALKIPPFGHKTAPVPITADKQEPQAVREGALLYNSQCILCHGLNAVAGSLPDLRYASKEVLDSLQSIVLEGTRAAYGMPSFKKILTAPDVKAIRSYLIARAQESAKAP